MPTRMRCAGRPPGSRSTADTEVPMTPVSVAQKRCLRERGRDAAALPGWRAPSTMRPSEHGEGMRACYSCRRGLDTPAITVSSTFTASAASSKPALSTQAHDALLRHSELQFDFPAFQMPKPPEWMHWLGKILAAAAPVLTWVFWIAVAVGAATILFFLVREALRLRWPALNKNPETKPYWPEWRPTAEQAQLLLADADGLAAQGHFAEAVHLLLLRSIQDIELFRPRIVQRAFTSREIGNLGVLPMSARSAFSEIMRVVETSLFGGRPVSAGDFSRCRSDYERFAFPDTWRESQA